MFRTKTFVCNILAQVFNMLLSPPRPAVDALVSANPMALLMVPVARPLAMAPFALSPAALLLFPMAAQRCRIFEAMMRDVVGMGRAIVWA